MLCHTTYNCANTYGIRPAPPRREIIIIGHGHRLRVKRVYGIDATFHAYTYERHILFDVSDVPGLGFKMYSLHVIQQIRVVLSDAPGTYLVGTELIFPRNSKGSCMCATRLQVRSINEQPKQNSAYATDLQRQFRYPIPSPLEVPLLRSRMSSVSSVP